MLILLFACIEQEPGPLKSTPIPGPPGQPKMKVEFVPNDGAHPIPADQRNATPVDTLFPKGPVAIPPVLGGLKPGVTEAEAVAIARSLHDSRVPFYVNEVDGARLVGGTVKDHPGVGFTAIMRNKVVIEIDLSLSTEDATPILMAAWGEGTLKEGTRTWTSGDVTARAFPAEMGGRTVVKFAKP